MIISHVPIAPHSPLTHDQGLSKHVRRGGVSAQIERFDRPWASGIMPYNPFGRWGYTPVSGSRFAMTSMRFDAAALCREHYPKLYDSILDYAGRSEVGLYIGANPVRLGAAAALEPFVDNPWILDASALQYDTMLDRAIRHRHANGKPTYREANRRHDDDVPCVARWDHWGRAHARPERFYAVTDAPKGSAMWFPRGIRDAEQWAWAEAGTRSGLDLIVNIEHTPDEGRLERLENK